MASPFYTAEHEAYREVVRRFVEKEIAPFAHEWDEAGERIERAVDKVYAGGIKPMEFGGSNGTADIARAVLAAL